METPPSPPFSRSPQAPDAPVESDADRDRVTLERLESELAVLEADLARVDAGDLEPPDLGPVPGGP